MYVTYAPRNNCRIIIKTKKDEKSRYVIALFLMLEPMRDKQKTTTSTLSESVARQKNVPFILIKKILLNVFFIRIKSKIILKIKTTRKFCVQKSERDTVLPFALWWNATPSGRDD